VGLPEVEEAPASGALSQISVSATRRAVGCTNWDLCSPRIGLSHKTGSGLPGPKSLLLMTSFRSHFRSPEPGHLTKTVLSSSP